MSFDLIAPMATSAMRAEDLNYILRYPNAEVPDPYCQSEFINNRWNDYGDYGIADKSGVANVANIFQTNIKNVDVISFCVGNANVGVFLLGRMTNMMGVMGGSPEGEEWVNFENALSCLDATQKQTVMNAYNQVVNMLKSEVPAGASELVDGLANVIGYAMASDLFNVEEALDAINQMNPTAEIILVGIMNTFDGVDIDFVFEGKEYSIPMRTILAPIVYSVNGYMVSLPTMKHAMGEWTGNNFYYAKAEHIGMIVDTYKTEIVKDDNVIRDRFITEIVGKCQCPAQTWFECCYWGCETDCATGNITGCKDFYNGTVWSMVFGIFNNMVKEYGLSLVKINHANVKEYELAIEENRAPALTPNQILSVGVYLAFEKAVLEASDMETLDATAFLSLAGDLNSVFYDLKIDLPVDEIKDAVAAKVMAIAVAGANTYKAGLTDPIMAATFNAYEAGASALGFGDLAAVVAHYALANGVTDPIKITKEAVTAWVMANYADEVAQYTAIYTADGMINPLSNALTSNATIKSLLNLFARMLIGNGLGCHPSAAGHDTLTATIVKAYKEGHTAEDQTKENIMVTLGELKDFLDKLDPDATAAILDKVNLEKAITSDLKLDEKSVYVALGDGSAEKKGYAELLGDHLVSEYGIKNVYNYAAAGNTVGAELAKVAGYKGIADASLITIGFSNVTMLHNAIRNAGKIEYNWLELVGEKMLPVVQEALGGVSAIIADMGLNENWTMRLNSIVEGFAYSAVEYAIKLPELVDEIRRVNDEAVIAVVGQYNPMAGVVLDVGGATLDMSEYIDSLVDAVTVHGIAYAAISDEFIFVEAPAVEISNTNKVWTEDDLVFGMLLNGFRDLYPSENGDQYIAKRILGALKINEYKPTSPFVDVAENAYYYDAVLWAVENDITKGTGDGTTFEPNAGCTRAQIATFLWRAAGCPAPVSSEMPFKDVAANAYYATAVLWAGQNGITTGTGDGTTFEPDTTCTRAQIVTMLARYLKGTTSGNSNPFTDVPANAYYTNAVLWAVEKGITTGTGNGTTFEPNATCTRGQIVTFLFRALAK